MSTPTLKSNMYTAPAKPESVRSRASRGKWWLLGIGLVLVLVLIVAITSRPTDYRPMSIENATDSGTRAVAQILRDQGVSVRQFDTLARVYVPDPATTTLVVVGTDLTSAQLDSILGYKGDVLFIGASSEIVTKIDPGLDVISAFLPETVDAACADPDATAAERMRVEYYGIVASGATSAELCFSNRSDIFGLARVDTADGVRTVAANAAVFQNGTLLNDGNAALSLRLTGHHENVAWYLTSYLDETVLSGTPGEPPTFEAVPDFFPPGFGTALYALALTALVAALWRGRRFGPLAVEPLPVVVPAKEATRGRARLYRRARAQGRATAALRAATARRIAARLGVPRSTDRDGMVSAIERATGRPAHEIARILYGPVPHNEAQMIEIVEQLDILEGEVHTS